MTKLLYEQLMYANAKRDGILKCKNAYWKADLVEVDREITRLKKQIAEKEEKESIKDSEFYGFMQEGSLDILERDKFIVEQERTIQKLNIKIRSLIKQNEVLKCKLEGANQQIENQRKQIEMLEKGE